MDGWIDIWDLLDRSHEPSMTTGIGSDAIVSMEFWNSKGKGAQAQQLLAIGDDQVHACVLPPTCIRCIKDMGCPNQHISCRGTCT